jgi:hypothetical protein
VVRERLETLNGSFCLCYSYCSCHSRPLLNIAVQLVASTVRHEQAGAFSNRFSGG